MGKSPLVQLITWGTAPPWALTCDGYGYSYGSGYGYSNGYSYDDGYSYGSGYGDGYSDGYGDGDGDGYGNGYGNGYSYGDGNGNGYGDGNGNGYGYGDGDGYGYGYGYSDGYGNGSGNGSGNGHTTLSPRFLSHPGFLAYWKSTKGGTPANGGSGPPVKAGDIQEIPGPLQLCGPGALHATLDLSKWSGERVWLVALHGEVQIQNDKVGSLKREILCELENYKPHHRG